MHDREVLLRKAVERAVEAADEIIRDSTDGSAEELDLLTYQVAKEFLDKIECSLIRQLHDHEGRQREIRGVKECSHCHYAFIPDDPDTDKLCGVCTELAASGGIPASEGDSDEEHNDAKAE